LLCFLIPVLCACSSKANPTVAAVFEDWLKTKTNYNSEQIDNFRSTLDGFLTTPIGHLYYIHSPEEMGSFDNLASLLDRLQSAAHTGEREAVSSAILEIDAALDVLRRIDTELSKKSQLHYFQLFLFFSLLIIVIIFVMSLLYSRLKKAERRELQSLAFSRESVYAQEQERERIAHELHDTVLQDIWRLSFQTESIGKTVEPKERSLLCKEVVKGQREVMKAIRAICTSLTPPDFHLRRLGDALRSLCYEFSQRSGIECQAIIQNEAQLEAFINSITYSEHPASGKCHQLHCFRIVQEALSNIEKHAQATEASLLVRAGPEELLICVSDNGKGFSPPDRDSYGGLQSRELRAKGHFGLGNMYERAASLGWNLFLDSGKGAGTMVTLKIPLINVWPQSDGLCGQTLNNTLKNEKPKEAKP
jgi:signal transduction histidine kinase